MQCVLCEIGFHINLTTQAKDPLTVTTVTVPALCHKVQHFVGFFRHSLVNCSLIRRRGNLKCVKYTAFKISTIELLLKWEFSVEIVKLCVTGNITITSAAVSWEGKGTFVQSECTCIHTYRDIHSDCFVPVADDLLARQGLAPCEASRVKWTLSWTGKARLTVFFCRE